MPKKPTPTYSSSPFVVKRTDGNAVAIHMDVDSRAWEQWFLLSSDRHHDNPHTNEEHEKLHLDQALERNAGILDFGDLFDCMQGKFDPRRRKQDYPPRYLEHLADGGNTPYLQWLIDDASEFYSPYRHLFCMLGLGNHETAIEKNQEFSLTQALAARLNANGAGQVQTGAYAGWVRFHFKRSQGSRATKTLWYTHGYGGGGPITKDTIQLDRQLSYVQCADIMVSGHVHQSWTMDVAALNLDKKGREQVREIVAVKVPTYKHEYQHGTGYHIEKGRAPRPIGAYWLKFYWHQEGIEFNIERAKVPRARE